MKPVESLQISDFIAHPVWAYANDDTQGETAVYSVEQFPVENLNGKIVGVQVQLANESQVWASLGNIDSENPRSTEHFLTLSLEKGGQWFQLARYHDFNYAENGPESLARFLDLPIDEIFPIFYNVTRYSKGNPTSLAGKIFKEPREKLSQAELIAIAVSQ